MGGEARLAITSRDPGGSRSGSRPRTSAAGPGSMASASSMNRAKAGWCSSALLRRVTADHGEIAGPAIASKTAVSIGRTRCRAAARRPTREAGSSSWTSRETHATARRSCAAAWARKVVLPYPAGAETVTSVAGEAARRSRSARRATLPSGTGCGTDLAWTRIAGIPGRCGAVFFLELVPGVLLSPLAKRPRARRCGGHSCTPVSIDQPAVHGAIRRRAITRFE